MNTFEVLKLIGLINHKVRILCGLIKHISGFKKKSLAKTLNLHTKQTTLIKIV